MSFTQVLTLETRGEALSLVNVLCVPAGTDELLLLTSLRTSRGVAKFVNHILSFCLRQLQAVSYELRVLACLALTIDCTLCELICLRTSAYT